VPSIPAKYANRAPDLLALAWGEHVGNQKGAGDAGNVMSRRGGQLRGRIADGDIAEGDGAGRREVDGQVVGAGRSPLRARHVRDHPAYGRGRRGGRSAVLTGAAGGGVAAEGAR
jgi:hypothetical protein